ncbi:MAG: hypothetical protein ACRYFZ_26105 [Janthinobacterium lividum]
MNEPTYLDIQSSVLGYFRKPADYFWRWAENGQVVEWPHGGTIGYREEVQVVLEALAPTGLPPFGAVLLLLAACADSWPTVGAAGLLEGLVRTAPADPSAALDDDVGVHLRLVLPFLDQVAALPQALRTGPPKLHLFRQLNEKLAAAVPVATAAGVVTEWCSGRLDISLKNSLIPKVWVRSKLKVDVLPLAALARRFEQPGQLELLLRTGLPQLPELPALPVPLTPAELFDQLAQDVRTAGLAHLTQHVVAALHIPLHTQGASDRPLGGVADITNRGNFDRLLLSELAHDDWSLLARLANNEALYLRREEPPRPQARPHIILLDTTLRLWGTPRVFGLAAALAWAHHAQLPRRAAVRAYALGGQTYAPLDFGSVEGVVQALSQLDLALHCGPALHAFGQAPGPEEADYMLITEAHLAQQVEFSQQLAAAQPALRFLLTVDRAGTLALHEYANGHRRLLQTSTYDLDELLFAARGRRPMQPVPHASGPAYLRQVPAPLYFPTTGLRMSNKNTFYRPAIGVLGITDTRRVLYWPSRDTGARELLPAIEPGAYYFGTDEATQLYVLVSAEGILRVYFFDTATGQVELQDLVAELAEPQQEVKVVFRDNCFYVRRGGTTLVFDCQHRAVRDRHNNIFPAPPPPAFRQELSGLKRYINNGYSVIHRISNVGVNRAGELLVDGYEVQLVSWAGPFRQTLQLRSRTPSAEALAPHAKAVPADLVAQPDAPAERLLTRRFTWPNGSEALIDARGLLHLRSADAAVPELSLLLVIGQPTAAWAADGTVCGPDYFTGPTPPQRLPAAEFYQQYLQRFTAALA